MCSWDVRVTYEAEILSLVGLALSFSVVYISLPRMARKLTKEGIAGRDVLKKGDVLVPESGGIMIIIVRPGRRCSSGCCRPSPPSWA
jgi:hypothetical protein